MEAFLNSTEVIQVLKQGKDVMFLSWISRTLSPQIAESVVYIDIAQNLGEDLRDRFSKGDHFRISVLLQDLHSIKQGERNANKFFYRFENYLGRARIS